MSEEHGRKEHRTASINPGQMAKESPEDSDSDFLEKNFDSKSSAIRDWPSIKMVGMDPEIIRAVQEIARQKKVSTSEVWRVIISNGFDRLKVLPEVKAFRSIHTYGKVRRGDPQHYQQFFQNGRIDLPYYGAGDETFTRLEPGFASELNAVRIELRQVKKQTFWRIIARLGLIDSRIAMTEDRQIWIKELKQIVRREIAAWIIEGKDILTKLGKKKQKTPYRETSFDEVLQPFED